MEPKILNQLFVVSSVGLAVAGLIFVLISMFDKSESGWALPAGLFCIVLAALFNVIRMMTSKYNKKDE